MSEHTEGTEGTYHGQDCVIEGEGAWDGDDRDALWKYPAKIIRAGGQIIRCLVSHRDFEAK